MENSIILQDSGIRDTPAAHRRLADRKNVRITKTDFKPKAYPFMLGDNSEVGIT